MALHVTITRGRLHWSGVSVIFKGDYSKALGQTNPDEMEQLRWVI